MALFEAFSSSLERNGHCTGEVQHALLYLASEIECLPYRTLKNSLIFMTSKIKPIMRPRGTGILPEKMHLPDTGLACLWINYSGALYIAVFYSFV